MAVSVAVDGTGVAGKAVGLGVLVILAVLVGVAVQVGGRTRGVLVTVGN